MKFKFRSRLFLYLLLLLFLFVLSQSVIYLLVEWFHWRSNPYESWTEGTMEVVQGVGLTLLFVPLLIGVAWLISRWMIRPVQAMAQTALRIRRGEWFDRIPTDSMPDDETRSLAEAMNAAYDRYASVLQRLQRFSGDAAHQLRTPIAAMRSLGEVALSRPRSAGEYQETLETMLTELDRLTRIVEQLLHLSRLEAGALRSRFQAVSLSRVVIHVQQIYQPLAEAGGVGLVSDLDSSGLQVNGIEELLFELLGNLVENAIRHSKAGGTVRIQGKPVSDNTLILTVTDSGPGIAEEYARIIFDRFAQIPGERSGAAGLGLSLAMEIAEVHGGSLQLANPGRSGAVFECRLPLLTDRI